MKHTNLSLGRCIGSLGNVTLWEGSDMQYRIYHGETRIFISPSLEKAKEVFALALYEGLA